MHPNELLKLTKLFPRELKLEHFIEICKSFNNPQKALNVIHVAGTNGKGSTCAMLSSVLFNAGYNVGLYTSPHLVRLNERIRYNETDISDEDLEEYITKLELLIRADKLSYFETLTLAAILYFKDKKVDYAIMEVGLGGRLDATNVCDGTVCVITSISLEHKDILGDTIKKIAGEKCGIIKENCTVITSNDGIVLDLIKQKCDEKNAKLTLSKTVDFKSNLVGEFQDENIANAVATLKLLGIDDEKIKDGLLRVNWPGRMQFIRKNRLVDCCHNPDSVNKIVAEVDLLDSKEITLVVGFLHDKDYKLMIDSLVNIHNLKEIIITAPNSERRLSPNLPYTYLVENYPDVNAKLIEDSSEAFDFIRDKKTLVIIAGSMYLVGEYIFKEK